MLNCTRAVYLRGDPYETSDAVFGVKESLIVEFEPADEATATQYNVPVGTKILRQEFILVSKDEADALKDKNALEAMAALGRRMKLVDHLPVPDLD